MCEGLLRFVCSFKEEGFGGREMRVSWLKCSLRERERASTCEDRIKWRGASMAVTVDLLKLQGEDEQRESDPILIGASMSFCTGVGTKAKK